jgi:hypothetical protein
MKSKVKFRIVGFWSAILLLSVLTEGRAWAVTTSLYSEQGFLGQENSLISSIRVRSAVPIKLALEPFVQLGSELSTLGNENHIIDSGSSYLFYGPGVAWRFLSLVAMFEWRQRAYYKISELQSSRDLRTSLIYNSQWFFEFNKRFSLINEVYGEGVLTSADADNTILSGWVRLGLRDKIFAPVHFDLYLEPYGGTDTRGRFYNRKVELRPTLRAQYFFDKMYLAVTGAYVVPLAGKIQTAGLLADRTAGLRVLAIVGGEI